MYPFIDQGMSLMKYVVNHPEKFSRPNSVFAITFYNNLVNVLSIAVNIILIVYKPSIEAVITHVVALQVINHLPFLYKAALYDDKMM